MMQALADPNSMGKQFFPALIQPIYFAHFEVDLRKLILESQTCSQRVLIEDAVNVGIPSRPRRKA
jgi:hypothetical protein